MTAVYSNQHQIGTLGISHWDIRVYLSLWLVLLFLMQVYLIFYLPCKLQIYTFLFFKPSQSYSVLCLERHIKEIFLRKKIKPVSILLVSYEKHSQPKMQPVLKMHFYRSDLLLVGQQKLLLLNKIHIIILQWPMGACFACISINLASRLNDMRLKN